LIIEAIEYVDPPLCSTLTVKSLLKPPEAAAIAAKVQPHVEHVERTVLRYMPDLSYPSKRNCQQQQRRTRKAETDRDDGARRPDRRREHSGGLGSALVR
jgi:hypothetical protein